MPEPTECRIEAGVLVEQILSTIAYLEPSLVLMTRASEHHIVMTTGVSHWVLVSNDYWGFQIENFYLKGIYYLVL